MLACIPIDRSIDSIGTHGSIETNQPTNQPLEQTIDQFHRFDRYAWFNRHQLPEQTIDQFHRFDRSPTIRTITPMVQKVKHPVMGQSNPESIDRIRTHGSIDRYRSIDRHRSTDREGHAPIGLGNPALGVPSAAAHARTNEWPTTTDAVSRSERASFELDSG